MSRYRELQSRVEDGSVKVVQLVGVPRSMSTALGRSLNESTAPSVFVNEPLNRENQDLDEAANVMLEVFEQQFGHNEEGFIIVKNMASYTSEANFMRMSKLARLTLWNIRHPLQQIGSLMTRIANDQFIGPGEDIIAQDDVYDFADQVVDYLIASPKSTNFSKTGWQSLGEHYQRALADNTLTHFAVDGVAFTDQPGYILRAICAHAGLPYSDAMYKEWGHPFVNVINRHDEAETARSAWTNHAATGSYVTKSERGALELNRLPRQLQHHIRFVALPIYYELLDRQLLSDDSTGKSV